MNSITKNKTSHIKLIKIHPDAQTPYRQHSTDAGADLHSVENTEIPPLGRRLIKTGLVLEIPVGFYGRIAPRSGLAVKKGVDVLAGVVDSSYRGEICVVLYNTDPYESLVINKGDRVAQLIIERHYNFLFEETDNISDTNRSINGFGSSGVK